MRLLNTYKPHGDNEIKKLVPLIAAITCRGLSIISWCCGGFSASTCDWLTLAHDEEVEMEGFRHHVDAGDGPSDSCHEM